MATKKSAAVKTAASEQGEKVTGVSAKKTASKGAAKSAAKSPAKGAAKSVETTPAKKSEAKSAGTGSKPTHEQIAKKAYEIWASHGHHHGRDRQHWEQAEKELSEG